MNIVYQFNSAPSSHPAERFKRLTLDAARARAAKVVEEMTSPAKASPKAATRSKTNIRKGQLWRIQLQKEPLSYAESFLPRDRGEPVDLRVDKVTDDLVMLNDGKTGLVMALIGFERAVRNGQATLWVDLDRLAPVGQRERDREEIRRLRCELNDAKQRLASRPAVDDVEGRNAWKAERDWYHQHCKDIEAKYDKQRKELERLKERAFDFDAAVQSVQDSAKAEIDRLQERLTASNAARLAERKPMSDAIAELRETVERTSSLLAERTRERDRALSDLTVARRQRDDYKQSAAINAETADCLLVSDKAEVREAKKRGAVALACAVVDLFEARGLFDEDGEE